MQIRRLIHIGFVFFKISNSNLFVYYAIAGAQWLSGRVLDSRPRGSGFEPHQHHCVVSLSKNFNPSLVLVQPRMTRSFITERLLMERKESNQTNKANKCQKMSGFLKANTCMIWYFKYTTAFEVQFTGFKCWNIFKGDISRFFIFHCKFLLYVGFYVFIKNPDHFPQCSVKKWVKSSFSFKLVRFVNKISTRLLPLN